MRQTDRQTESERERGRDRQREREREGGERQRQKRGRGERRLVDLSPQLGTADAKIKTRPVLRIHSCK